MHGKTKQLDQAFDYTYTTLRRRRSLFCTVHNITSTKMGGSPMGLVAPVSSIYSFREENFYSINQNN
jgi:hypothetical protein